MQRISTAVTAARLLDRLRADEQHGARELTSLAARVLGLLLADPVGSAWRGRLERGTAALLETQPAMAPLLFLANAVWLALEGTGGAAAARVALQEARAALATSGERVAEAAVPRLASARTILTISRSSSVLAALARLAAQRSLRVIVGEGQPAREGRSLAAAAARRGCRVTVVLDAALPGQAREADAVLVGADALLAVGAINKVGTYPLLLAARDAGIPSTLLADRSKLVPPSLAPLLRLPPRDPGRLWRKLPPRVSIARTDFELTPLSLLSTVVTEEGPAAPTRVARRLAALPAARFLQALATTRKPDPQARARGGNR